MTLTFSPDTTDGIGKGYASSRYEEGIIMTGKTLAKGTLLASMLAVIVYTQLSAAPLKASVERIFAQFIPASIPTPSEGTEETIALILHSNKQMGHLVKVSLHETPGVSITPTFHKIMPGPVGRVVFFKLKFTKNESLPASISAIIDGKEVTVLETGHPSDEYFAIKPGHESDYPKPTPAGSIGKPLPFRRVYVDNGVLRYNDGSEVSLWGVNYYPQSSAQYLNMKSNCPDMKKAIQNDLDDMKKMGVEVIRIHVFDREISDAKGNLVDNIHLDLLDYLISEGSKRGIYFFFTPIAWWPTQHWENPDSFSSRCPKEYMFCDDETIIAEANYLKNWLNHVNRYTGKQYKNEPAFCALEIMNEPAFADYNRMMDPESSYYEFDKEKTKPFKKRMLEKWQVWCASNGLETDKKYFPIFRYELESRYLDAMYKAVRHTGAKQPIAVAIWDLCGGNDLMQAIADSQCEGITINIYAGDWNKSATGVNLLKDTINKPLDPRLGRKARLAYEWDGIKTMDTYFYPTAARHFRNRGAQISCVFQYDSSVTAEWNLDWDCHYLNLFYTPGKSMSFEIGGRVFHDLPRGSVYSTDGATQTFGNCVASFDRNISIYSDGKSYLNTAPFKGWNPLSTPKHPTSIMGVGDSPYIHYSGTGIYTIKLDYIKRRAELTVNPDADLVGDPWTTAYSNQKISAVVLKHRTYPFILKVQDVTLTGVKKAGDGSAVPVADSTFTVTDGDYILTW